MNYPSVWFLGTFQRVWPCCKRGGSLRQEWSFLGYCHSGLH